MKNTVTVIQMLIRLVGTILLILGIIFWIGQNGYLIIFHILFGVVLVLLLWALAWIAARRKVSGLMVAITAVWGLILPVLGLTQAQILPGPAHWVIHVVHLLVGIGAIGFAEFLGRELKGSFKETIQRPRSRARTVKHAK